MQQQTGRIEKDGVKQKSLNTNKSWRLISRLVINGDLVANCNTGLHLAVVPNCTSGARDLKWQEVEVAVCVSVYVCVYFRMCT